MEKIINNIMYSIPQSWDYISLEKYLELRNLKIEEDEEFKPLAIISHYIGCPLLDLKRMNINELRELITAMSFISTTEIPDSKPIENFVISGETYHVMQSMLNQQAQDYFAMEAVMTEAQQDSFAALPKILAIICRKTDETLDTIDMNSRQILFKKNLSVVQANSLRVFFYSYAQILQINSQLYLNRNQIIHQKQQEVEDTMKPLAGMGWRGRWLKKTLEKLMQYYINHWNKYYSGTASKSKKASIWKTYRKSKTNKRV
jgi:hypothetical protein